MKDTDTIHSQKTINDVTEGAGGDAVHGIDDFNGTVDLPNDIHLEMVKVTAGSFLMGSPRSEKYRRYEETQHRVTLTRDYWLGRYEVTQEQYEAVMGTNPSYFKYGGRFPVEQVSWVDADAFCEKLNDLYAGRLPSGYKFSLPTGAQWEYAARGGGKSRHCMYSGANDCDSVAWYYENSGSETHIVGQKQANELGLCDMSGNVGEWCRDWYDSYGGDATDPAGPASGSDRVIRGGGWDFSASFCRAAFRSYFGPSNRDDYLGFRLALVPVQSARENHMKDNIHSRKTINDVTEGAGGDAVHGIDAFNGTVDLPNDIHLEMVKVTAGSFLMGSPSSEEGRIDNETQHRVTLTRDYWLGRYEVTQEQYEAVMETNPSLFNNGGRFPVEEVSWDDAVAFCEKLNGLYAGKLPSGYKFSLPTEAQWEYAARGGSKSQHYYAYSGGDDCDSVAWYLFNSEWRTHIVGQKQANELGLFDMSGNVWEWCLDQCEMEDAVVTDTYREDIVDPVCKSGSRRVFRGGGWGYCACDCRAAYRGDDLSSRGGSLGFRLALVPVQ